MHHILVFLFLLSGTANVLLIKWTNTLEAECNDGKLRFFQHPVFLTMIMFAGELVCYVIFKCMYCFLRRRGDGSEIVNFFTNGDQDFRPSKMFYPAFLHGIASILLFNGLYLTYASSFQMIRSSCIIFVAFASGIQFNTTLTARHWSAMLSIALTVFFIIINDLQRIRYDQNSLSHIDFNAVLSAELMIICAGAFEGIRMVYEEKYIKAINIPLMQAIGWRGIFGLLTTALWGVGMNYQPAIIPFNDNSRGVFDDFMDISKQLQSNHWIIVAISIFFIAAAVHGYTGLCITKFSSSSNLIHGDCLRTYVVSMMVLLLRWEQLNFISWLCFISLQFGIMSYRRAILMEWYRKILLRLQRNRYNNMSGDNTRDLDGNAVPTNRQADVI
ncbi:uncharacterized protein LOC119642731 [Glossina fuscipes]|uniref:Uncharacterized protein LOC119642731 n=1 Tax=Glossina fuscipes TaxID=7396 RepID=A0A9C5ZFT5_9MUSC|nr:uncharacterized protein LOC119642731 [Glossina fuscipes]